MIAKKSHLQYMITAERLIRIARQSFICPLFVIFPIYGRDETYANDFSWVIFDSDFPKRWYFGTFALKGFQNDVEPIRNWSLARHLVTENVSVNMFLLDVELISSMKTQMISCERRKLTKISCYKSRNINLKTHLVEKSKNNNHFTIIVLNT